MHIERKDHCVLLVTAWSIILRNEYAVKHFSSVIAAQVEKQVKDKMKAVETEAASEEQLKDYLISLVSANNALTKATAALPPVSMLLELGYFQSPQQISLDDSCSTITALGQGTIHIVINGLYCIQQHAITTKCTPVALMFSSNHIHYEDCALIGKNNLQRVIYPTFSFTITGNDCFEFPITPGKNSTGPLLWQVV